MPAPDLFSVPRRFDLATVLVAMLGFALLFAGMRSLDMPPAAMAVLGGLFVAVAFGQWVANRRGRPREASIVAAGFYWFAFNAWLMHGEGEHGFVVLLFAVFASAIYSFPTGYLVGTLVGGVFLVSHHLREHGLLRRRDASADHPHAESPWDESPDKTTADRSDSS